MKLCFFAGCSKHRTLKKIVDGLRTEERLADINLILLGILLGVLLGILTLYIAGS